MSATKSISITSGLARLTFHPSSGRFDVSYAGGRKCFIKGATAGVTFAGERETTFTLADGKLVSVLREAALIKAVYRRRGLDLEIEFAPAPRDGAFEVNFAYTNTSAVNAPVKALLPLCSDARTEVDLGLSESRVRIYRNGLSGWATSNVIGLLEPHMEYPKDDSFWGSQADVEVRGLVRSALMAQVRCKGAYLTIGFLSAARQFGMLSVAARGAKGPAIAAAAIADGKPVAPKRRYYAEPLYIAFGADYARSLVDYASLLAERMDARRAPEQPAGWCSWYYYYGGITEAECLDNLRWLAANRHRFGFRIFQIDDGWQADVGDWLEVNNRFPRGMKALADDVRAAGFTPGLWFAPFICTGTSRLFREHPDWLVKNAGGTPRVFLRNWDRDVFSLDLSNARVLAYIAEVTSKICYDWGYDYIKIDFLDAGAAEGFRRDNTKTRAQNYRRGLEVVRQVAGPDKYILGCNGPVGPGIGLFDAMRASPDVGPNWSGGISVLSASWALTKFWIHNILWHTDPDCLILRDGGSDFTPAEARTLANMTLMAGGNLMVSEKMTALSGAKLKTLAKFFPVSTTPAVPLDLYERSRPAVYFAAGKRLLLGVFNWEDREAAFTVNPRRILGGIPATRMADFWTGDESSIPSGRMKVTLQPHESRLFIFT